MKLKTLRNIETFELSKVGTNEKIIYSKQLKQEAIKWVKEYEKDDKLFWLKRTEWIKHFFNLKEEDLK